MDKIGAIEKAPREELKAKVLQRGQQALARQTSGQAPTEVRNANAGADLSRLSEEAMEAFAGPQSGNVSDMLNGIESWFTQKLDDQDGRVEGAGAAQGKKKRTEVSVEFTPMRSAGQVSAPGSAVGEIKLNRKEKEEPAGPEKGSAPKGAAAKPAPAPAPAPSGGKKPGNQQQQGQDRTADEVQMSGEAAQHMQQLQQKGQQLPTESGMAVTDNQGNAAPIPKDGGILKSTGLEQTIWIHPGGDLKSSGGLIEVFQNLGSSPSRPFFEQRSGQDGKQIAAALEEQNDRDPHSPDRQNREQEIQKLRNPVATS